MSRLVSILVPLVAILPLLVLPAAAAPDDHVQLVGAAEEMAFGCPTMPFVLTVERSPAGYVASLESLDPYFLAPQLLAPFYSTPLVVVLQGDWETGFFGRSPGFFCAWSLRIGPYGSGQDVQVTFANFGIIKDCHTGWWTGSAEDAALL